MILPQDKKEWIQAGIDTGLAVGLPLLSYFGISKMQDAIPGEWGFAADSLKDGLEVSKTILTAYLANHFGRQVAEDDLCSENLGRAVGGVTLGALVTGLGNDIAYSNVVDRSKEISDFMGNLYQNTKYFLFVIPGIYGAFKDRIKNALQK